MIEFRNQLIDYLRREKELTEAEIARHRTLSDEAKEEAGLMIRHASIDISDDEVLTNEYRFRFDDNQTKIRIGDKVKLICENTDVAVRKLVTVLEVSPTYIVLETGSDLGLDENSLWSIEVLEVSMFESFIKVIEKIEEGQPGSSFISQLAGEELPEDENMFGVSSKARQLAEALSETLNEAQADAVYYAIKQPSVRLIQGPPGTGKTHVLACICEIMAKVDKETAIVAKTHQAVNNALNKVKKRNPMLTVIKVGQELRSDGLDPQVLNFATYQQYLKWREANKRRRTTEVVGMTLQAATVNMGMRNTGFKPQMVLVDEASQIPVAEAAIIGASGVGSIIFIGDDRQMPPIFVQSLENDPLSMSVFEYLAEKYPDIKDVLDTTYRMNDEICEFVSERYYRPYGIDLVSDMSAASRRMVLDCSDAVDERMELLFGKESPSIVYTLGSDPKRDYVSQDENVDEAQLAAEIAVFAMQHGIPATDIAVVTPFRKQVNAIRSAFTYLRYDTEHRPLVDTVERLQGQDVRLIILSFAVTDPDYFHQLEDFITNENRLNVMISRAKEKVVILKSYMIRF